MELWVDDLPLCRGIHRSMELQRNVAVLPWRVGVALAVEHFESADQAAARFAWADDSVDIAALSGDVGIREALAEFRDALLTRFVEDNGLAFLAQRTFLRFRCAQRLREFAAIDDVDCSLRAHHGDLRRGPREVRIGTDVLR